MILIAVRQEVNTLDKLVIVHELEFAMERALYGRLCSLGSRSLSWLSVILTANLVTMSLQCLLATDF